MAQYRIHFVDHGEKVFDAVTLERDSDEAVIEEARRLDVPSIGIGFDVLREHRLLHRHRRATLTGASDAGDTSPRPQEP